MSAISDMPLERIRDAERVVRNHLQPTPLVGLGERTTPRGSPIVLKAESVQPTGSFKVRGALNRIARLTQERSEAPASSPTPPATTRRRLPGLRAP